MALFELEVALFASRVQALSGALCTHRSLSVAVTAIIFPRSTVRSRLIFLLLHRNRHVIEVGYI